MYTVKPNEFELREQYRAAPTETFVFANWIRSGNYKALRYEETSLRNALQIPWLVFLTRSLVHALCAFYRSRLSAFSTKSCYFLRLY